MRDPRWLDNQDMVRDPIPRGRSLSHGLAAVGLAAGAVLLWAWLRAGDLATPESGESLGVRPVGGTAPIVGAGGAGGASSGAAGSGDAPSEAGAGAGSGPGGRVVLEAGPPEFAETNDVEAGALEHLVARVVDRRLGTPVAGALAIQASEDIELESSSDAEGEIELALVEGSLRVRHPGYVDLFAPALPIARPLVLELTPAARLDGRVVDAASAPVPDVRVVLGGVSFTARQDPAEGLAEGAAEEPPTELIASTDEEGRFSFDRLAPAVYTVVLSARGDRAGELAPVLDAWVDVASDDDGEHLFVLPGGATLEGIVRLHRSNSPVADVRVELAPEWDLWEGTEPPTRVARTDAEGRFEVSGLSRGTWQVSLRTEWGAVVSETVQVPGEGETLERSFQVRPAATVSGRVYDGDGDPVAGARVLVTARPDDRDYDWSALASTAVDSPFLCAARSDASGEYLLERVPTRQALWILALPPPPAQDGERPGHFEPLRVVEGEVRTGLDLVLEPGTTLDGVVRDDDGAPIEGVAVEAFHTRWGRTSPGRLATTDADGRFRVGPLPFGATRVEFSCEGYRDAVQPTKLVEGVLELMEQELAPTVPVTGAVVDGGGWGIEGAQVIARLGPQSRRERATTDAYGNFELEGLTDGRWQLRVKAQGYRFEDTDEVTLVAPDVRPVLFVLSAKEEPEAGTVHGELVWKADGRPVWDLSFSGVRGGSTRLSGASFEIDGIRPGRARIVASAPGMESIAFEPMQVGPGARIDLGRHEVRRATRLTVAVRDAAGAPLKGARVRLEALPSEKGGRGKGTKAVRLESRGRKGMYEDDAVPRYAWRLRVTREGHAPHSQIVRVNGGKQTISVVLKPAR